MQAAFTAHGVPWDKFFIVNAVTFKVRIIYFFYNVIAGRLALARQRLILSRHGFNNYKLFRTLFKKHFGDTPMKVRKHIVEQD